MLRREWRQQILLVALLTVAVAAAVAGVSIVSNSGAPDDAEFGSATHLLRFDGADPQRLEVGLGSARKWFGTTEIIGYRSVSVPGSVDTVEFRAQDPHGIFASELLALRRGSYPVGGGQVAVTDGVADLLALEIGDTLALDGHRRTVVGIVENPRNLTDEFALVAPAAAGAPDSVSVLVSADAASIDSFRESRQPGLSAWSGSAARGTDGRRAATLAMFSIATVFLLLVSLVAAAGFTVIAQRRLRQLGLLAATGATPKHLRLVLLTNGVVVGAIGTLVGTVVGLAIWFAALPTLETGFDHRIGVLSLPWALLALVVLIAMLGTTLAAWWPGRAVTRVPITIALSARPPRPKPAHRSALLAVLLIAGGVCSLALADRTTRPLIVAGLLATILGTLLLCPLAIRVLARAAGHVSIAPRLALRDLARYQSRSAAALAAMTLALGITAAVVVVASAEEKREAERLAAKPPNLSDRQIRVYTGRTRDPQLIPVPPQSDSRRAASAKRVRRLAAALGAQAVVIPLWKAVEPGASPLATFEGDRAVVAAGLARKKGRNGFNLASSLYVATPLLLRHLGIDPATIDPTADFLADPTVPTGELVAIRFRDRFAQAVTHVQRINSTAVLGAGGGSSDLPSSFVTVHGLRRYGWTRVANGWLVESSRPLKSEQIAAARKLAADAGLTIEVQKQSTSLARPIAIATGAGALLALTILAMTVGLIRSESRGDLRTLTATGATSRTRRTLTGTTAGALALLGALLGVAGAYLTITAIYLGDLDYLGRIPVVPLGLIIVGVPLTAAAAGWLAAAIRQPPPARMID